MKTISFLFFSLAFWHAQILMKICIELLAVYFLNRWENLWNNINYLSIAEWIAQKILIYWAYLFSELQVQDAYYVP